MRIWDCTASLKKKLPHKKKLPQVLKDDVTAVSVSAVIQDPTTLSSEIAICILRSNTDIFPRSYLDEKDVVS